MKELEQRTTWKALYRGILIEIHSFLRPPGFFGEPVGWTYYLLIPRRNMGPEAEKAFWLTRNQGAFGRTEYDYTAAPLDFGFHGGITWYSQISYDGREYVKVGCDYQHLGDEATAKNEQILYRSATTVVDNILEVYPDLEKGGWQC